MDGRRWSVDGVSALCALRGEFLAEKCNYSAMSLRAFLAKQSPIYQARWAVWGLLRRKEHPRNDNDTRS